MWDSFVILLLLGVAVTAQVQDSRVVQIDQGPVRGYREAGRNLFAFYNIPYASVPPGKDRFKAPLPPPNWTETFEAVNRFIVCSQTVSIPFPLNEQEDCLMVDVFVPDTNQTNLSVMVSVHGGAFELGFGTLMNFRTFAETKNVIVVTFNYRLAVHGFLCLGTKNAPGNAGLKDQVALLRWINRNIASFGGNPNDVTIMGCSAGGVSVDLLTISKTTRGLFHKAIVESGAHISTGAIQVDPIENAKRHARNLNFTDVDDLEALENFYLETPLEVLNSYAYSIPKDIIFMTVPCVERDVGEEMFLSDAPFNIVSKGDYPRYPTIYGFANLEGLFYLDVFDEWKDKMNDKFSDFLPGDLKFESDEVKEQVARRVKEVYFGQETVNNNTILGFIDYYTDVFFAFSILRSVELQNKVGNTSIFLHMFSFHDENTTPVPHINHKGANHCDQMIIALDEDKTNMTEEHKQMKAIMRDFYHNFITTGQPVLNGEPVPSWPMVGANRSPYLSLGTTIGLNNSLLEIRYRLWEDIYQRYYSTPIPPAMDAASNTAIINAFILMSLIVNYIVM